jgi:peptidoglycan/LPS O-acetylase OafA/YrhL
VFTSHKVRFAHGDAFGIAGVWLFFVLSGFLITRILAQSRVAIEMGHVTVAGSLGRFYLRRTARIFPPYYLLIGFFFVASLFVSIDYFQMSEKLAYIFYGTNFWVASRNEWPGDFGHFWSLAIEEQFYLLFAPLVLLTPRRRTMAVCLAVIVAGVVTKLVLEFAREPVDVIDVNSIVNFALLGIGGVVGLIGIRSPPKWMLGGGAQATVLFLFLLCPAMFGTWRPLWPQFGMLSGLWIAILLFQIFSNQQSWLVAFLDSSPLRKVGRVTYGAYLFHPFIHFYWVQNVLQHFGVGATPARVVQVPLELAASLVLAAGSWWLIEKPIMTAAGRIAGTRGITTFPRNANT